MKRALKCPPPFLRNRMLLLVATMIIGHTSGLLAQSDDDKRVHNQFGVELGLHSNNLFYEQSLGRRFTVKLMAGYDLSLSTSRKLFDLTIPRSQILYVESFAPTVRLSPRWYHSGSRSKNGINSGGFVSFDIFYRTAIGAIGMPYDNRARWADSFGVQPSWGYNLVLNDHFYLKGQLGLLMGLSTANDSRKSTSKLRGMVVDLGVCYRF